MLSPAYFLLSKGLWDLDYCVLTVWFRGLRLVYSSNVEVKVVLSNMKLMNFTLLRQIHELEIVKG